MGEKIIPLFLNPVAGRGRARRRARSIVALLESQGLSISLHESARAGDLEQQVFHAATNGARQIIIAGGDGSVHEAVNGILAAGGNAALAVIPVGTGNDFAKSISTPCDWREASSALARRLQDKMPPQKIDAGRMNDRFFANGAGIGFDAGINDIAKKYRWPAGNCVYLLAVFEGILRGVTTPTIRLRYTDTAGNDDSYTGPITLANISNGPWVGGMFPIAPDARNNDGYFDLVLAEAMSRRRLLRLLPSLLRGRHIGRHGIRHARITEFTLEAEAPLPSHLDGEDQPLHTVFRIRVLAGALALL